MAKNIAFTWNNYLNHRIDRIKEGIMYMHLCDEKDWPVPSQEFDEFMKLVEVINLERKMYMSKTTLILDFFDLLLNFDPKAPKVVQNQYRDNIREVLKLVKQSLSC